MQGVQEKTPAGTRSEQVKHILTLHKPGTHSVFANHQFSSHSKILQERAKWRVNQARTEALCLSQNWAAEQKGIFPYVAPSVLLSFGLKELAPEGALQFYLTHGPFVSLGPSAETAKDARQDDISEMWVFIFSEWTTQQLISGKQSSNSQLLLAPTNAAWQGKRWKCLMVPLEIFEFPHSWMPVEQNCAIETWEISTWQGKGRSQDICQDNLSY